MSNENLRKSLALAAQHFAEHPQDALSEDKPALATLESGLRCRASGPNGTTLVSDMPPPFGGAGSAPTPGWLLRAALANCNATVIAMRAAQLGIVLTKLEVTVGSHSDHRGLLAVSESVPAGPLSIKVAVRIAAQGVPAVALQEMVHWAEKHSPVSDALCRAMPVATEVLVE